MLTTLETGIDIIGVEWPSLQFCTSRGLKEDRGERNTNAAKVQIYIYIYIYIYKYIYIYIERERENKNRSNYPFLDVLEKI